MTRLRAIVKGVEREKSSFPFNPRPRAFYFGKMSDDERPDGEEWENEN